MTNTWLKEKHMRLIGSADFTPHDYGHLLWHWGLISDDERDYLKTYGKLRGLVLACQDRIPVWSHCHKYYSKRSKHFTDDEISHIEKKWRRFSQGLGLGKLGFLDWLTQDEINYNMTQQDIKQRYVVGLKKFGLICS